MASAWLLASTLPRLRQRQNGAYSPRHEDRIGVSVAVLMLLLPIEGLADRYSARAVGPLVAGTNSPRVSLTAVTRSNADWTTGLRDDDLDISVESRCGAVAVGLSIAVAASFVWRCPMSQTVAPFPHPAHRTGHADFPHPALGQDFTPSPTTRRASGCSGARARSARIGAGVDSSRPAVA